GMELIGTHHRGIDDARNIAAIYKYMKTKKLS
ncbi:exonuclease, partial [Nostoc sp. NIES-2111]